MSTALKGQDLDFLRPFSKQKRTLVDMTKTSKNRKQKSKIKLENNEVENKNPFDDSFAIDPSVLVEYPSSSVSSSYSHFSNSISSFPSKSKSVKSQETSHRLLKPFTAPWILQRIRAEDEQQALVTMRSWVYIKTM